MKKLLSILFAGLLLLQAVPVLHFFAQDKAMFYTYVDEDKPGETKLKVQKEYKEYLSCSLITIPVKTVTVNYSRNILTILPAPFLEYITPPPNSIA